MTAQIETLKEGIQWYNHIELAGIFFIGTMVVSKAVGLILERWLSPKPCADCGDIKNNQKHLRDDVLPQLFGGMGELKAEIKVANAKLDMIMKDQKLTHREDIDAR
jgi:hypothetical protein